MFRLFRATRDLEFVHRPVFIKHNRNKAAEGGSSFSLRGKERPGSVTMRQFRSKLDLFKLFSIFRLCPQAQREGAAPSFAIERNRVQVSKYYVRFLSFLNIVKCETCKI